MKKNFVINLKKPLLLVGVIFLIVAVILAIGAVFGYKYAANVKESGNPIPATIIYISTYDNDHTVYVEYEIDGQIEGALLNSYSSSMRINDSIMVYLSNSNDKVINAETLFLPFWILLVMCLIFFVISIVMLATNGKSSNKTLIKNGIYTTATITDVRYKTSVSINGHCPTVVTCTGTNGDTYSVTAFVLGQINQGDQIDVYIHPTNPKKYYVDLDHYMSTAQPLDNLANIYINSSKTVNGEYYVDGQNYSNSDRFTNLMQTDDLKPFNINNHNKKQTDDSFFDDDTPVDNNPFDI